MAMNTLIKPKTPKAIDLIPQWLADSRENRLKICPHDEKLMRDIEDGFINDINKLKQKKGR